MRVINEKDDVMTIALARDASIFVGTRVSGRLKPQAGDSVVDLRGVVRLLLVSHAVGRISPRYQPVTHLSAPGALRPGSVWS